MEVYYHNSNHDSQEAGRRFVALIIASAISSLIFPVLANSKAFAAVTGTILISEYSAETSGFSSKPRAIKKRRVCFIVPDGRFFE